MRAIHSDDVERERRFIEALSPASRRMEVAEARAIKTMHSSDAVDLAAHDSADGAKPPRP